MKLIAVFSFITILVFGGCSEHALTPTAKQYDTSVISPLVSGDEWIYTVSSFDSTGIPVSLSEDTVRVGLSIDLQGETWYFITESNPSFTDFFTNRKDGYWFINNEISMKPFLLFKYPASVGEIFNDESFRMKFGDTLVATRSYVKISSTNTKIISGAKIFTCYHFQSFSYDIINNIDTGYHKPYEEQDYAPGFGRVRMVVYGDFRDPVNKVDVRNGTIIESLKSFTIK